LKAIWIPNILSGLRVVIAAVFPLLNPELRIAFLTFAILTEFLDGALARKFNWVTSFGQVLDPIADRLFALSVGLTFIVANKITPTHLALVLTRDIAVSAGLLLTIILLKNVSLVKHFKPNLWGKITTALQYLVFYDILLSKDPHVELIGITSIFSVVSAILYTANFLSIAKREEPRYGA
jgi:cardiolipin synthase